MHIVLSQILNRDEPDQKMFPALGLGYLAAFASERMDGLEFKYAETADEILAAQPDVVGISSVSENFDGARLLVSQIREVFDGPLILGGIHISTSPGSLPRECDVGVIGEGELTFLELIRAIAADRRRWKDSLGSIPGLCYWSNDKLRLTPEREQVGDLDTLPYPDESVLGKGWATLEGGTQYVVTSRGCPYDCSFCSSAHFWHRVRYFSAEYVLGQLSRIIEKSSPRAIIFGDDLLIANKERLSAIASGIESSGIADDVSFLCNVRSNHVDKELCSTLKRMNVSGVALGLESGSDRVLGLMNKRTSVAQHENALRELHEAGMNVYTSFILGTPGETIEDIKLTVDFIERNQRVHFDFDIYPLIPYPGTRFWDYAVGKGLIDESVSSEVFQVGALTFTPDKYLYLNEKVPRETFLHYFFYLKYLAYRNMAHRRGEEIGAYQSAEKSYKEIIRIRDIEKEHLELLVASLKSQDNNRRLGS